MIDVIPRFCGQFVVRAMNAAIEGTPPPIELPRAECDFNACGLSGESDDNCYYVIYANDLARLQPQQGVRFFAYVLDQADDGSPEVFGYIAGLERYDWGHSAGWRARPVKGSWYRGPAPWL